VTNYTHAVSYVSLFMMTSLKSSLAASTKLWSINPGIFDGHINNRIKLILLP